MAETGRSEPAAQELRVIGANYENLLTHTPEINSREIA